LHRSRLLHVLWPTLLFTALVPLAHGAVLEVGPGRPISSPSEAARTARDGDVVEIHAATYEGDVAVWTQNHLTLRGVGGRPHLKAAGRDAEGKAIWVIKGVNTTVERIEFSGARVPHRNGAGIRQEGIGLTVRECYFHDNENSILGGGGPESDVVIERSEFARNGYGDGQSHNLYIGRVRSLTVRGSYLHHARVGHDIKSRAARTYVLYNRIMDEAEGAGSYAIDLPEGGVGYVIGNAIQQGPRTENPILVAYASERIRHPVNELYIVNNTLVNDGPYDAVFIALRARAAPARIVNNLFVGSGTLLEGAAHLEKNLHLEAPGLADRHGFDYRLHRGSPAIDAGIDPGTANGVSLTPVAEYADRTQRERRVVGPIDVGAYEFRAAPR
jgi:hypothetical protein